MSSTIKFLDLSLHDLIDKLNPELRSIDNFDGKERKREFYAMSPEGHEILDEETAAEVAKEAKCGSFRFSAVGIPVGATIHYINDESIIATVLDDCHISYKGVGNVIILFQAHKAKVLMLDTVTKHIFRIIAMIKDYNAVLIDI